MISRNGYTLSRNWLSMVDRSDKLFVVYNVPNHCGHEVIDRVFTSLEEARKYVDPINERYSKSFSFWDGSGYALEIKTKLLKDGKIEEWEGCDVCETAFTCQCIGDSPRKTEEAYKAYWTPERTKHVHEHFHKRMKVDDCKFCIDPKDEYTMIHA